MNWQSKSAAVAIAIMAMSLHSSSVQAMPEQGKVVAGQGEIARPDDKTMVINQKTDRLALDWQKFNIAKDEKVHFDQNSKSAIAINRVVGDGRSIIDGSLSATGNVFVINPNGVLFGKNSSVDVGGLVASTAHVTDDDLKNFTQGKGDLGLQIAAGREASVINAGTIKAEGGLVALHATTVENTGTIANEGGTTALAAAKNLNIAADTAGKLNFTVNGRLANAKALNSGMLQSDGGYIVMTAKSAGDVMSTVVNNTGIIEAKILHTNDKGEILLDGGASGQVEVSGTLNASGMEAGQSAGSIKVIGEKTVINDGTNLLARGTIDGGKIETSGDVLNLGDDLTIDAKGVNGKAGEWLLDPLDVYIWDEDPTTKYDSKKIDIKKYETNGSLSSSTSIAYHDPAQKETADATATSTGITWIKTKTITDLLNNGTDVTIQAAATNGVANITVNSPIKKESGDDATFTLDAMRNITINKDITSTSGKLNVKLNSDTNGNKIGAVIINADIDTNGGNFTSTSGGNTIYTSSSTAKGYDSGTFGTDSNVDPQKVTVGTYFGNVNDNFVADGFRADRSITTKGGSITLNGEVAIGLAGGALNLDSATKDADGNTVDGDVTVTGIINSGNSYATYIYGTDAWKELIENSGLVDEYLNAGTVPSYHYEAVNYVKNADGTYKVDANGNYETTTDKQTINGPHYTFSEANTEDPRWIGTGNGLGYSTTSGEGWTSVKVTETSVEKSMTVKEFLVYYKAAAKDSFNAKYKNVDLTQDNATIVAAIKSDPTLSAKLTADINDLLSVNWFVAKNLAQGNTKGGSVVDATYLATLTTILENSLTAPESATALFVGARGSGVLNKKGNPKNQNDIQLPYSYYGLPNDPLYSNGMYWVTGPEGEANSGKGTQFYSNVGSDWSKTYKDFEGNTTYNSGTDVYGFVNWDTWPANGVTRTQPDNSGPFLTVGYGTNSQWDDTAMAGGYGGAQSAWAKGFVQEKNLANSSLKINSGTGEVKLQGDIGKSKALDTVSIESTNAVTVGTDNNNVTDYYHGTIYVDHGLYISGNGVKVGGEIHSGESEETNTSTTLEDTYKDNVTILSSGNIEVHGITANPYTASGATTANGGKISLTSTGDSGKITLGAGVDYDGNATAGTIAAGSSDNGAVIIDAQGKTGAFINSTDPKSPAITTGTDGTWQVYVASPSDYGTFLGDNLNSGTNAQWSSESTKKSTSAEPDKNAADRDIGTYTDHTHNKFIFQVTPTITVFGQDMTKTYGDTLSDEDLRNKLTITSATFKASGDTSVHSVDDYSKNFQEASDKSAYIASTKDATDTGLKNISVSSEAQAATATRTDGYKVPAGGTIKSTYHFNVRKENATGLNGYDLETENADIDILKRTITIKSEGQQTYGNGDIKWTDAIDNLADGDKNSFSFEHTIKTDGAYAKNKTENGYTTTAGANETPYENSIDYANLKVSGKQHPDGTDDPDFFDENYTLDTDNSKGSIKVNKANLIVNTDGITTTYGTVDKDYKSSLDKTTQALNGDKEADLLKELGLTYTLNPKDSAYIDSDGDGTYDKTNHVKYKSDGTYDSYNLDVANANTLNNYDVTVNDSTVTLERAKVTVDTDKVTTDYGTVKNTYTSHFNTAVNGDNGDELLKQLNLSYSTEAYKDADHTNNVKDGGYDLKVQANASLTYNDYDVKVNDSNVTLNKVNLTVNPEDIHRIYGQAAEVQEDGKTAYNLFGFANGDTKDTVDKEGKTIDQLVTVTNDVSKALKDNGTHTQNASTDGYDIKTTATGDLTNYNIVIGDPKKVYLDKAKLTVSVNDTSTTYGSDKWTPYTYTLEGNTNGDKVDDVKNEQISVKYTNGGKNSDASNDAVKTQAAGEYALTGEFTLSGDTATNYEIDRDKSKLTGKATVNKADLTLTLKDVSTTYGNEFDGKTYGYKKDAADLQGLTNGDAATAITDVLQDSDFKYVNGGAKSDPNNENVKTQNAGSYQIIGSTSETLDNYNIKVVNPGTSTVEKATLHLSTGDYTEAYGDAGAVRKDLNSATKVTGEQNGDNLENLVPKIGIHNTSKALLSDTRTNDVKYKTDGSLDSYGIATDFNKSMDNYDVVLDKAGSVTLTPVEITVDNEMIQTYGSKDRSFKEVVDPGLVNGDKISTDGLKMAPKANGKYETNKGNRTTADAGTYKDDLAFSGGGIVHEDGTTEAIGNYKVTFKGDIIVKPAPLNIKTDDVTIDYGTDYTTTVGKTVSSVDSLTNGDAEKASDLSYDYGNYGGGYIENNTKTKRVGDYDFKTTVSNKSEDFLKNYTISGGDATLTINPKDVYFHVDGNGKTLGDVVYTVTDPNNPSSPDPINRQLVYGETVTPSYTPDGRLSNGHYGVSTSIDGKTISDRDVYGNYRYHYDGDVTLSMPNKPDFEPPVNPPVTPGTGTVTPLPEQPTNPSSNTPENTTETTGHKTVWDGERDRGGDRPEDKRVVTLPFFKVLEDKTTHRYGTYDVAKRTTEVKIEPSAQVLPEPNQPATQYRELTTELTTDKGTGEFTLKYNGSRFTILPDDDAAMKLIVVGDETKNRALFEKALHVAFTQMGLEVADLDGVYIHFGKD